MAYSDLIKSGADATDIQKHLTEGQQVAITIRIPENLRNASKEEAALRGMSFSAFIRTCLIEELSRKGV